MTTCAMCGDCCRAIVLKHPLKVMRSWAKWVHQWDRYHASGGTEQPSPESLSENNRLNAVFIAEHWHRISKAGAEKALPGITRSKGYFYTCDAFDGETNRCTAHDTRPPVCSGFPFYEKTAHEAGLNRAFPRCSYWADIDRKYWPEGCSPLPSPELIQIRRKEDVT